MGLRSDDRRPFGPFVNLPPQQTDSTSAVHGRGAQPVHRPRRRLDGHPRRNTRRRHGDPPQRQPRPLRRRRDRPAPRPARRLRRTVRRGRGRERIGGLDIPGDLPDASTAESRTAWLRTASGPERPADLTCVVERVREQAARRPDAVAVEDDDARTTYASLVARASARSPAPSPARASSASSPPPAPATWPRCSPSSAPAAPARTPRHARARRAHRRPARRQRHRPPDRGRAPPPPRRAGCRGCRRPVRIVTPTAPRTWTASRRSSAHRSTSPT